MQSVADWVDIAFEAGFVVDELEMPSLTPLDFQSHDFQRWTVEFFQREGIHKSGQLRIFQENNNVHIVGHSRLTVENRGHTATDHVADSEFVETTRENQKWFIQRHA